MSLLDEFQDIVKRGEPLAPHTWFQLGGPAEYFARPRSIEELSALVVRSREAELPLHVLGGGSNVLIRDEGVRGVVIKLDSAAFLGLSVRGNLIDAGAGVPLSTLLARAAKSHLAGLEPLAGIPGSVGGALLVNAGGRNGDIGQTVRQVTVMGWDGQVQVRSRQELEFGYRQTNIDSPIVLGGQFELEPDEPGAIMKRMRKTWIAKNASQPLGFQPTGCIFKDTNGGLSASMLIDQAGLKGTKVGGAEVSEREANFIIAHRGCTARDVLRLIDLVRSRVREQFGIDLELDIQIW